MVTLIQIFEVKRTKKNLNNNDLKILEKYTAISKLTEQEILTKYQTTKEGINQNEASKRLAEEGKNIVIKEDKKTIFHH